MECIGAETFSGCSALEDIEIPEGIFSVDAYAFYMADGLKKITLPESLAFIGEHAFDRCDSLTSITIPEGVRRSANTPLKSATIWNASPSFLVALK